MRVLTRRPSCTASCAGKPQADLKDPTSDAYRTLFIGRLALETTEKKLAREFETYGPVTKVRPATCCCTRAASWLLRARSTRACV